MQEKINSYLRNYSKQSFYKDFKPYFFPEHRLTNWLPYDETMANRSPGPRVVRGTFVVTDREPRDTYFDYSFSNWLHGAVFINGFNIGR